MKPDKGDWLAIVNVFAANGLGEACLSPFSSGSVSAFGEHVGFCEHVGFYRVKSVPSRRC